MINFKNSYQKVLMLYTVSILFTSATQNTNGLKNCLEGMERVFYMINRSPLSCIIFAITMLQEDDGEIKNYYDAKMYYKSFHNAVITGAIQPPIEYCHNKTKTLASHWEELQREKCLSDLKVFERGDEKLPLVDVILMNALYTQKQNIMNEEPNSHNLSSFGFDYLEHIAENIILKDGLTKCLEGMTKIFGKIDISPLDCIKHAIRFLRLDVGDIKTKLCSDVRKYYFTFQYQVKTDDIVLPYNWCDNATMWNAVFKHALYYNMQDPTNQIPSAHDMESYGYYYLNSIHGRVMLINDKMFDPVDYCKDLYGIPVDPLSLV